MKNSKLRRVLLLLACAVMLVSLSVGATLAYLTDSKTVTNTFTVGNVQIKLDEAKVDEDGKYVDGHDNRTDKNDYKLQPGNSYYKDPTVTVLAKSENCYVRTIVTIKTTVEGKTALEQLQAAFPVVEGDERNTQYWDGDRFLLHMLVSDWKTELWDFEDESNLVYEFRYVGPEANEQDIVLYSEDDTKLEDLFTAINIPGTLTNDELAALAGIQIEVVAHAIQADGFADADEAWSKF